MSVVKATMQKIPSNQKVKNNITQCKQWWKKKKWNAGCNRRDSSWQPGLGCTNL